MRPSRASRTFAALFVVSSAAACKLPPDTAYDQRCAVDADCIPLRQDCGCTTGAINRSEGAHAEFDFVVERLPVAFMVDCGTLPACLPVPVACNNGTCAAVPDTPAVR